MIDNRSVRVRQITIDDTPEIVAFFARTQAKDNTITPVSAESWEQFTALPPNRHGRDFRAADINGRIVGVASSSLRDNRLPWVRHFRIFVEPQWRRNGIGRRLLRTLVELDSRTDVRLQSLCPSAWKFTESFLKAMAFQEIERELEMECGESTALDLANIKLLELSKANTPVTYSTEVATIHNDAYKRDTSFVAYTSAQMSYLLKKAHALWIAKFANQVVGYCHLELDGGGLRVESIAVSPPWQSRHIGTSLLYAAMNKERISANQRACLSVSDKNLQALKIYHRLGFRVVGWSTRYEAQRAQLTRVLCQ